MAEFPALPLWTDAYIADCGHLSWAEHGLYINLLMAMWRADKQRLPNDDVWLGRRFRLSQEDVVALLHPLMREFCQTDGNWVTQKRLLAEWEFVKNKSDRMSDLAKTRWNKDKQESLGNAVQHALRKAPTPTPTPIKKERKNGVLKEGIQMRSAGEQMRLDMAKKGMMNVGNSDHDFRRWIEAGEMSEEEARRAGASI